MTLLENVRQALAGLVSNKMRSLLTMLGIIIGIGSVIAIMSVGDAMTSAVSNSLTGIGVNKVMVMLYPKDITAGAVYTSDDMFTDEMLEAYESRFSSEIEAISLSQSVGSGTVTKRHRSYEVNITGVNPGYALASSTGTIDMLQGRFITDQDVSRAGSVIVISEKLADDLFPNQTAVGQDLRVELSSGGMETLRIVGVYDSPEQQESAMMFGTGLATDAYIPLTAAYELTDSYPDGYLQFTVAAKEDVDYRDFSVRTQDYFNSRYYADNPNIQCMTQSMDSMLDQVNSMMSTLAIAIAVIAGISLLVGGIGVMNIMLVSVTERTREIGIRKSLGARDSAIRLQFIVESTIICFIGGIFGILAGAGLGALGGMLLEQPAPPSLSAILIAVSFSMLIGVFFGYYPANKAAKLDPIEALRYE